MKTIWNTVPHKNWTHARQMRREPSPPEQVLWTVLKDHATGVHFRRQHPVGAYITDFCAPRHRLIIEVDGSIHLEDGMPERDAERDEFLIRSGFRVLHFTAWEVMNDLDHVVSVIRESLPPNL